MDSVRYRTPSVAGNTQFGKAVERCAISRCGCVLGSEDAVRLAMNYFRGAGLHLQLWVNLTGSKYRGRNISMQILYLWVASPKRFIELHLRALLRGSTSKKN
jgi:hypothetical protein